MFDGLKTKAAQEAVRYAVQRALTCPTCSRILDMDDAVLVTSKSNAGIACGKCYDKQALKLARKAKLSVGEYHVSLHNQGITVDDGRVLKKLVRNQQGG